MKKTGMFALILMVALMGCDISDSNLNKNNSDAHLNQQSMYRIGGTQKWISINGHSIQEIVSIENDGSQPPESPVQQYEVVYSTEDGLQNVFYLQIETNSAGEIVDTWIVNTAQDFFEPKAMTSLRAGSFPIFQSRCPEGCTFACVHIWEKIGDHWIDYYKCVCIGGAHC